MVTLESAVITVGDDLKQRLAAGGRTVSVELVESSVHDNQLVFTVDGDVGGLLLDEEGRDAYDDLSVVDLKLTVTPSKELVDVQSAELPEC